MSTTWTARAVRQLEDLIVMGLDEIARPSTPFSEMPPPKALAEVARHTSVRGSLLHAAVGTLERA